MKKALEGVSIRLDFMSPYVAMEHGTKTVNFNPSKWSSNFPIIKFTQLQFAMILFHELVHVLQEFAVEQRFLVAAKSRKPAIFGKHEDMNDYLVGCFVAFLERNGRVC